MTIYHVLTLIGVIGCLFFVGKLLAARSSVNKGQIMPQGNALAPTDVSRLVEDVSRELAGISPNTAIDPRFEQNIQTLIDNFDPNRGRFWSWWLRGKAEGRNKLLTALNEQQRQLIEQGAMLASHAHESQKAYADTRAYVVSRAVELFD